jgi:hypothetical protein
MRLLQLWDDVEEVSGDSGRKYYRLATITWSRPGLWSPERRQFDVPPEWAGRGGVYAFIRHHWKQQGGQRIAYIGKALNFSTRLVDTHDHFSIIERRGETYVSCGRVSFGRIRSRPAYYVELEDVVKFAVFDHLENKQGFETLPGFRASAPKVMAPWVITNAGYRFGGVMPRRIVYPSIGVEY